MHYMLLPLKRYADFSGRSRRKEYWLFVLFQILVTVGLLVLMVALGGAATLGGGDPAAISAAGGGAMLVGGFYLLFSIAMLIPSLAVGVRRLHDIDRTGWWMLAPLAPYPIAITAGFGTAESLDAGSVGMIAGVAMLAAVVMGIVLIVFYFLDGTRGPNRYGADPKGGASPEVFA